MKWLRAYPKASIVMVAGLAAVLVVSMVSSTTAVVWSGIAVGIAAGMLIAYESGREKDREGPK